MNELVSMGFQGNLIGETIGGWHIASIINSGKSAVVFNAVKDSRQAALKVFSPALVARSGIDNQLERIKRELTLVGHDNPHLIQIYDGGICQETSLLFIAMEVLDGPDLSKILPLIPASNIWSLIGQLADAAQFLEQKGLAHRDIKPSNIVVLKDYTRLKLLDLGVLRPIGESELTDENTILAFVGTLQYSSPEFLVRTEEDTLDGWRAITFYQIGAVIHDLITRTPIFSDFVHPYARLVDAVKYVNPDLDSPGSDPALSALAKKCLVKDPVKRLSLLTWKDFANSPPTISSNSIRERIMEIQQVVAGGQERTPSDRAEIAKQVNVVASYINTFIRNECIEAKIFPQIEVLQFPIDDTDKVLLKFMFQKSDIRGVKHPFCFYIGVTLVDIGAGIIRLETGQAVSTNLDHFDIGKCSGPSEFYTGSNASPILDESLRVVMYSTLESAMNFKGEVSSCTALEVRLPAC